MANDNPFWRFSLAVYAAPGVSDECIALQDRFGVDVNVLLFATWLGAERGLLLTPEHFARIEATIGEWQHDVLAPVRKIRRRIKAMADRDETLYREIKVAELKLEQVEQAKLHALAATLQGRIEPRQNAIRANLEALVRRAGADNVPAALIAAAIAQL